jgi:curved DNA-binding protein CbpA
MDYYKILNVNQNSTKEDMDSSYQEQLSKLNQAYNVLSDPKSKKQYDQKCNRLSLFGGYNRPFENVLTRMQNSFSDSLFSEISNQPQLTPNNLYQKSYSYSSDYDSDKGINHVKKVFNDNGKETVQEYDEPVKPKYIDSWGLTRVD